MPIRKTIKINYLYLKTMSTKIIMVGDVKKRKEIIYANFMHIYLFKNQLALH